MNKSAIELTAQGWLFGQVVGMPASCIKMPDASVAADSSFLLIPASLAVRGNGSVIVRSPMWEAWIEVSALSFSLSQDLLQTFGEITSRWEWALSIAFSLSQMNNFTK